MLDLKSAFFAYVLIGLLLLAGRFVRQKLQILRSLYLPSSVVAGVLALLLGPQVLGAIAPDSAPGAMGAFSEPVIEVWRQSPGVFINVVFAALFLGETLPNPRDIWQKAAPQIAFGQSLAWGQYVIGSLVAMTILVPVFGMSPISAALIEIAFEGGHGTAAGMSGTLAELGFPDGADLAVGLATVGIVAGIVTGTLLAQWGRSKGYITKTVEAGVEPQVGHQSPADRALEAARARLNRDLLVDPLSLNIGFVGAAIALGWLILQGLAGIEALTWGRTGFVLIPYVPLFPMTLIGGILVQILLVRLGIDALIDRRLMERIAGVALDVVVVSALATISLQVLGSNFAAFLILAIVGIIWNVAAFLWLAPRILPTYWFERGIGDLGQSMGVTATGILLLRMVDPDNRSGAFESFAYKQLFFEPIVGGGLFTAAAPIMIHELGVVSVLALSAVLLAFWLGFGLWNYKRVARSRPVS